mmetsp:Transcript_9781/g.25672  ORF Transcript_9781/g.25672 Transcript_9781/m.25672 type:complete len:332 (+) Transcript_9781:343-1338(+)
MRSADRVCDAVPASTSEARMPASRSAPLFLGTSLWATACMSIPEESRSFLSTFAATAMEGAAPPATAEVAILNASPNAATRALAEACSPANSSVTPTPFPRRKAMRASSDKWSLTIPKDAAKDCHVSESTRSLSRRCSAWAAKSFAGARATPISTSNVCTSARDTIALLVSSGSPSSHETEYLYCGASSVTVSPVGSPRPTCWFCSPAALSERRHSASFGSCSAASGSRPVAGNATATAAVSSSSLARSSEGPSVACRRISFAASRCVGSPTSAAQDFGSDTPANGSSCSPTAATSRADGLNAAATACSRVSSPSFASAAVVSPQPFTGLA